MITVYEMKTCPDCQEIDGQLQDSSRFRRVDIGKHVANLKEFLRLRDQNPAFEMIRLEGYVGIPCFVKEDGSVCFDLEDL